ncbi:heterokaryon incompatibility protein-domain-containing protein [Xylaria telfairii]|nr:heterokaryon incompatibility protein-domain-containing protein [Xylaria telfairii]
MLPSDSFIPTRLIRVDHDMQSLVEMNEQTILAFGRDSIKYAALSYCWGPVEKAILQLTTEKNSVKDRTSGIMETEMTSVLRGAVTACRALSIPFLWVDALCIIQDDTNDWEQESSLMGRIYTNAYLTLCALSSESCTGDFLERRTTAITVPFQSSIGAEFRGAYSLTPARYGKPESIISSDVSHSRWSERGWTLQEEFLSKRMLAFGQFGLHFMCSHGHQTQHRNIQPNPYSVLYHRILNEKNNSEVYIEWHESIVIASSTRRLTRPTDRFPSISSLAACFNEKLHDTYVAGLWQNELYKGLYWVIAGPTLSWAGLLNDIVTPTSYVAPSWSWASRQSYIYFGGERFSTYGLDSKLSFSFTRKCDAAAAEITLANAHYPYGRLSHAVLTIKTRVQKLSSEISMKEEEHFEYSCFIGNKRRPQMMCTIDWKLRQDGEPLRKTIPENVMLMLLGTARQYIRPLRNRFSLSLRSRPVSAIPKNEEEDDKNVEDEVAYGLLIYKLPGTDDFIRVGTFYSRAHDDWGMRLFEDCGSTTISLV